MQELQDILVVVERLAELEGDTYLAEVAREVASYPESPFTRRLLLRYLSFRNTPAHQALTRLFVAAAERVGLSQPAPAK
ncbi:hypothetical protein [Thermus phage P23-45]|uniref:Uncharacterized protein n=1 Tax=Thermus virus P23-45 TaxID=2914006 RepID=A7XX20_BP234|nr:hypothetical protein P23p2 [Thermus phage P23-45]ABU96835.1 hypothetical protein P23p2 [Thermus phage P23-45]UYB98472.1 hypothetical protein [Thermus phage P23-45]